MTEERKVAFNPALGSPYGEAAPGKNVIFPGQLNAMTRAPAHLPGSPKAPREDLYGAIAQTVHAAQGGSTGRVEYRALHPAAKPPALGSELAAGYDLSTPEAIKFAPGERKTIPLGFALALPEELHARIESRSGLALKGLVVLTGVIDADYRGELKVIMQNFSDKTHEFAVGDRVAQLVLRHTIHRPFETVEELSETSRGTGGFGSTGT